jgi:hypothetical protein
VRRGRLLRLRRRTELHAVLYRCHLRKDGDRDFGRRLAADVEPDGTVEAFDLALLQI